MKKKQLSEQDEINKERLVDINLILQYMETLDVTKEYFTELGEGHLRGLASAQDEVKFVDKKLYDKLKEQNVEMYCDYNTQTSKVIEKNTKLKEQINYYKKNYSKKWFKW